MQNLVPRQFTPRRISGCTLWLDACDFSTLYQTTDTSTPIELLSNAGRWESKDGSGRVVTQSSAGRRMVYSNPTGAPAGVPALTCGGATGVSSDQFDSSLALTDLLGTAEATIFLVVRSTAAGGILGDSTGTNLRVWWNSNTQISATLYNGSGGESTVASGTVALSTKYIVCVRRTASVLAISINGGAETTLATSGNLSLGSATLTVPDRNGATKALGWSGDVAIFNRSLGANDRNRLGRWLASKWEINWVTQVA